MIKAEDRYLEHFQDGRLRNCSNKGAFLLGYRQAEKDLALTWEDMMLIHRHIKDAMNSHLYKWHSEMGQMEIYNDVLRRFLKDKGYGDK